MGTAWTDPYRSNDEWWFASVFVRNRIFSGALFLYSSCEGSFQWMNKLKLPKQMLRPSLCLLKTLVIIWWLSEGLAYHWFLLPVQSITAKSCSWKSEILHKKKITETRPFCCKETFDPFPRKGLTSHCVANTAKAEGQGVSQWFGIGIRRDGQLENEVCVLARTAMTVGIKRSEMWDAVCCMWPL